jgi:carboxypeptidase Q
MKCRMFTLFVIFLSVLGPLSISAQNAPVKDEDAFFIRKIYDAALTESRAYPWLSTMCTQIGSRLSGSEGAAKAVDWTKKMLDTSGFMTRLQPCMVPNWKRGDKEIVKIRSKKGDIDLRCLAIGNSVGTGDKGVEAEVIEVKSLDEVDALGDKVKGKIVFYNRPMDRKQINTFAAYGGAGDQRRTGPSRAAKYGAVAVLVRTLSTELDDRPHTGSLVYDEKYPKIAAVCLSTNDAEVLSKSLSLANNSLKVYVRTTCEMQPDAPSNNVIGEIRGSEFPNEVIVVGGHLDSWDVAQGAHDDGAGCVQSMDVLNLLKQSGYKPKRTIRCVLFMNEENGLRGGTKYAEEAMKSSEKHIFALESDAGGFTPRGITFEADPSVFVEKFKKVAAWEDLLKPYGIELSKGSSGADIGPLKPMKLLLGGLKPDSQRYFDFHHTEFDRIEYVNRRELELGAGAMTALVYLIDKYGL